ADQMPLLKIREIKTEKLADGLFKIWVTVDNTRLIPTRVGQDVASHISPPDVVSLAGPNVKVLSAGRITDPYFKRVDAVKRRPERIELDTIRGVGAARVQFIVSGTGEFTVKVDSAKGGVIEAKDELP